MDQEPAKLNRLLVTGGAERIGSYFIKPHAQHYAIRMVDRVEWDTAKNGPFPGESHSVQDLSDFDTCRRLCDGMDAVIHLAADPHPDAPFSYLLPNNFITTYRMFLGGARRRSKAPDLRLNHSRHRRLPRSCAGVPRDAHLAEEHVGRCKIYSENVGKYFALTAGLPTICLRTGACIPLDMNVQLTEHDMKAYINPDELNQLIVECLESHLPYSIVHATSQNRRMRRDLTASICAFDYHPQNRSI